MNINTAYFAGGCFWCMTKPFDQYDGIEKVVSGYMGAHETGRNLVCRLLLEKKTHHSQYASSPFQANLSVSHSQRSETSVHAMLWYVRLTFTHNKT